LRKEGVVKAQPVQWGDWWGFDQESVTPAGGRPLVAVPADGQVEARGATGGVRLGLLGGFRLEVAGHSVGMPRAGQRALAALALAGPVSRSRLAGTLWPESPQAQALTNLRHVLWKVANACAAPALVELVGSDLGLSEQVEVDTDQLVNDARAILAGGVAAGASTLLRPEACELLPDWDEEWLADDRERLRQLRLHALEAWAESLATGGSFGLALDVALVALRTDVLRESAHRTVIKVHRLEGNVREARRAFEACRKLLATEMGVPPSPLTVALVP
jgi:DNA-binding SARP family transcriptional activator